MAQKLVAAGIVLILIAIILLTGFANDSWLLMILIFVLIILALVFVHQWLYKPF